MSSPSIKLGAINLMDVIWQIVRLHQPAIDLVNRFTQRPGTKHWLRLPTSLLGL
jgi:hypothetical protein